MEILQFDFKPFMKFKDFKRNMYKSLNKYTLTN